MKIIIKKPNEKPYVTEVEDDLKIYQDIVGGYIEVVDIGNNILLVCNEGGKLYNLPVNFYIGDTIVGTVFFVGKDGEDFRSLTDEEIDKVCNWF